jgi:hypothetical protein
MNSNIVLIEPCDDGVSGIFHIQSLNYKKHFESLVKNFYPSKDLIPNGNFNALQLIETFFPDIQSRYNSPKKISVDTPIANEENKAEKKASLKKPKKTPLVTDAEAELRLLERIFNLDRKSIN